MVYYGGVDFFYLSLGVLALMLVIRIYAGLNSNHKAELKDEVIDDLYYAYEYNKIKAVASKKNVNLDEEVVKFKKQIELNKAFTKRRKSKDFRQLISEEITNEFKNNETTKKKN